MAYSSSSKNQKIIDGVVVLSEFNVGTLENPPADKTFLYAQDDGSGKTVLKTKDSLGSEKRILATDDSLSLIGAQPAFSNLLAVEGTILNSASNVRIDAGVPVTYNSAFASNLLLFWVSSDAVNIEVDVSTNCALEIRPEFKNLESLYFSNPHNNHTIDVYVDQCQSLEDLSIVAPNCHLNSFVFPASGSVPNFSSFTLDVGVSTVTKDEIYNTLAASISTTNGTIDTSASNGSVTSGSAAARAILSGKYWAITA